MAAGQGVGVAQTGIAAFVDNLPAATARLWPHIDNVIGRLDHIRVMFDDDDGVAFVAQFLQQFVHAVNIARVQPNAGLIKNIHHIDQAAAQMFDDLDALRFAAGEGVGGAVEAEIFEPNVNQMLQPLGQGRDHRRGDRIGDRLDHFDQIAHFHRRQFGDIVSSNFATQCRLAQPCAMTEWTGLHGDVGFHRFLDALGQGLEVAFDVGTVKTFDHPSVGRIHRTAADLQLIL